MFVHLFGICSVIFLKQTCLWGATVGSCGWIVRLCGWGRQLSHKGPKWVYLQRAHSNFSLWGPCMGFQWEMLILLQWSHTGLKEACLIGWYSMWTKVLDHLQYYTNALWASVLSDLALTLCGLPLYSWTSVIPEITENVLPCSDTTYSWLWNI